MINFPELLNTWSFEKCFNASKLTDVSKFARKIKNGKFD